jgi:hypothetical protein
MLVNSINQNGGNFIPYPDIENKDFYEKIYKKKEFYDTRPPRNPLPDNHSKETLEKLYSKDGDFKLLPQQRFLRNFISENTPYNGVFIWHGTGTGKCERKGTKILLYNGEIREIQDLKIGDILMSDTSEGNVITSLARGRGEMFEIKPVEGDSYFVNSEHILCLKRTNIGINFVKGQKWKSSYLDTKEIKIKSKYFDTKEEAKEYLDEILKTTDNVVEIEVKNYLKLPKNIKKLLKGFRTAVEFEKKEIKFDPYLIGLWLGDDLKKDSKISSLLKSNDILKELQRCNLINNKHIPLCYKANTREIRLQVLAGLLDSNGHYCRKAKIYEITQKNKKLANDILYLSRSLGFSAYLKESSIYQIIHISGNLDEIPVKIRKKNSKKQIKNPLLTGINVIPIGIDDYYGFTLTGNCRYLHDDFTVTHNTCSSIAIAERFHKRVLDTGKKILMIVSPNIAGEFFKTIFNFEKEASKKSIRQVVQCTGRTYQLGPEDKYLPEKTREKRITKMIKEIYEIVGTDKLRNRILRETGWNGKEETLNENISKKLKEMFSDRIIVIDEVHNRVGTEGKEQSIPTILKGVIRSCKNIKLIMMTATPTVNSPTDIIFPINLLRLNDRKPLLRKKDIFDKNGDFIKNGEKLLKEASRGYFSYIRGDDPPRFPYNITPPESKIPNPTYSIDGKKLKDNEKIRTIRVIECKMSNYQYSTYKASIKKDKESKTGGLLTGSLQAGNIVFPLPAPSKYGVYGSSGIGDKLSQDHPLIKIKDGKDNDIYKYSDYSQGFLLNQHISKYSVKFSEIFNRITNSIGVSFVYSQFLSAGVTTLALMLEENGFIPAIITGKETELLQSKTKKPPICYMCGKPKHKKTDHQWAPAKYVLLTGSQNLNRETDISKISGYINREENMYGKLVKVLLGSEVSGEGIDFKRIRQVHIMEPWYNYARLDQVTGRAIRNGSHKDLPPEQRNVEIFKYCIVPPKRVTKDEKIETVDERDYRYAEDKDRKNKKALRPIKEVAIDCSFQRDNNLRLIRRNIKLENSRGQIINFITGDKPYSRECDYLKSCEYECDWNPKSKEIVVNKSTYGPEFAQADIEKAREFIQEIYKNNFAIDLETIFKFIRKKDNDLNIIYIYLALESLMNPDGDYSLQDIYGREGYLIERNDLFIFQPFDLADEYAPFIYRKTPLKTKVKESPFPISEMSKDVESLVDKKHVSKGNDVFSDIISKYDKAKSDLSIYVKGNSYDNLILEMVLDEYNDKSIVNLIKYLLRTDDNFDKKQMEFSNKILFYYQNIGSIFVEKKGKNKKNKEERKAIMVGKTCVQWGRSDYGMKKKLRKDWGKCDPDIETYLENLLAEIQYERLWYKIPSSKRIIQGKELNRSTYLFLIKQSNLLPNYIGTVEEPTIIGTNKAFKLLDFTREEEIKRKDKGRSKRSEIRGRVCTTFKVPYLKKTLMDLEKIVSDNKIKNVNIDLNEKSKKSRTNICQRIQFLLRLLNLNNDKIWFYKGNFIDDLD